MYVALDYVIDSRKSLSCGNLGADDSCIVSLGTKGLSGTESKDSIRGSILRVINVNLVRK